MNVPRNQVLTGDAARVLSTVPDASVDMVLTSPPYFRLRRYGMPTELGREDHVEEWVAALRGIARQVHRVLTPTGSLWLNVTDTYATHARQGANRKSVLLGPERLALALVEDGWLLRNKIVWQKANPMPSSVRDRLSCTWEALYVFVKQRDYFFGLDAIRTPHLTQAPKPKGGRKPPNHPPREVWRGPNSDDASGLALMKAQGRVGHPLGKNPGDVWRIASSNYRGGHHATFPVALAERAIRAGCPEVRCTVCHSPWRRSLHRLNESTTRGRLEPTCDCGASREPGLVLDPFFGAGTTGVAARLLGRDWLGVELNPAFVALAQQRIDATQPARSAHAPPGEA